MTDQGAWHSAAERFSNGVDAQIALLVEQLQEAAAADQAAIVTSLLAGKETEAQQAAARLADAQAAGDREIAAAVERVRAEVERDFAGRLDLARGEYERSRVADLARIRQEARQVLAKQVQRLRHEAEETRAADITRLRAAEAETRAVEIGTARDAERRMVLAGMNRLLRAVRHLDDAQSLTEILEALCDALQDEAARAAVLVVLEGEPRVWRLVGFSDEASLPADVDLSRSGIIMRAIETADTCFTQFNAFAGEEGSAPDAARGLAVPISMAGKVSAVVYADDRGRRGVDLRAWADVIEVLVRHAGRSVEAFTARHAAEARALADPPPVAPEAVHYGESVLTERRAARRMRAMELPWVGGARILPGRTVSLIDLSDGGALVEGDLKLDPDTNVVLQLIGQSMESRIPARVLRCSGHHTSRGTKYRGAVTFTEPIRETQFTSGGIEPRDRSAGPWLGSPTTAEGLTPSSPVSFYR